MGTPDLLSRSATSPSATTKRSFRPEIHALRALAVSAVLVFHVWPVAAPGGYVGVDVFFVISGFLITGHLWRESESTGRVRLARFWARRVRRLLPAALLVLLVTTLAIFALVPRQLWRPFLEESRASALYFENWLLASNSVDYLAADGAASPFQHYWSLSVEEQFYLVWPLLVLAAVVLTRRFTRNLDPVVTLRWTLATIALVSFAVSLWSTINDPAPAYFVTYTRVWQFAVGGLVALLPGLGDRRTARTVATTVGWVMIVASVFVLDSSTPFPGTAALLPTLGAASVILGGAHRGPAGRVVEARPVQWLGDVSYSVYLWHWPIVILLPWVVDEPGAAWGVVVVAVSLALGHLTKLFVEDPVRTAPRLVDGPSALSFALGAAGMAIVAGVATAGIMVVDRELESSLAQVDSEIAQGDTCFGAAARVNADRCADKAPGKVVPALSAILDDTARAYECYDTDPVVPPRSCKVGPRGDDVLRIALVGDSHAAMLRAALEPVLAERRWSIDTFVGRGCAWSEPLDDASDCAPRRAAVAEALEKGAYDAVVVTYRRDPNLTPAQVQSFAESYARAWERLAATGTEVVAVKDNPTVPDDVLACLTGARDYDDARACTIPVAKALGPDPIDAAGKIAGVDVVDLTDLFCDSTSCPTVIGDAIVYRDNHHITATYAKSLGPVLADRLAETGAPFRRR